MSDKRVVFDFEVEFTNGGGLQGQGFRLDIVDETVSDATLGAYVIADLGLLMVGEVRILNKQIIQEGHKRGKLIPSSSSHVEGQQIELSHVIEGGMITYKGFPAPLVCDHISHLQSRAFYAEGTEFQIGKIEMVGNTGTYIDTPYHRYRDGFDLAGLSLEQASNLEGVVVRVTGSTERAIDWQMFAATKIRDRAVLVHTGWDRHWRTDQYFEGHPFLTRAAADYLKEQGAKLVGIDSLNIDDTSDGARPVHTCLLGAGIPIVEHLTQLAHLPIEGFRFSAVPPKIEKMGTFPVRAYAILDA